jgi:hypothetical protein
MFQVEKEKFVDASEPNESGMYDYYYSGTNYVLLDGSRRLVARIYDDSTDCASFISDLNNYDRNSFAAGIPYEDQFFCHAVQYFLDVLKVQTIKILTSKPTGGYEDVDLHRVRKSLDLEL